MSGVQMITVAEADGGQRLDRWLRQQFPQLTQGRIEKMCRKGDLRVDGGRVKASTRVEAGQTVRVPPIPDEVYVDDDKPEYRISDAEEAMILSLSLIHI